MYFEYNHALGNPHKHFLLNEKFTLKNLLQSNDVDNTEVKCNKEEIEEYIKSLVKSAKHYYFIHNLEGDTDYESNNLDGNKEITNWLKKTSRLGFGSFELLILAILHKRKEYDISNEKLLEAFKEIERCLFLVFGLSPRQATLESSTIYNFARWFYYKDITLDAIKDEVRKICR